MKRFLFWGLIVIILGGTVFALAKLPKKEIASPGQGQVVQLATITAADWVAGNKESAVTLVEYSDFQCPACAAYYPLIKKMLKENSQDFQFVYRHFPLRQHAQAKDAAYAAEAAGRQGKFWEMTDLIFNGQTSWAGKVNAKDIFLEYAKSLNLNLEKFNQDRNSGEIKDRVEKDLQDGLGIGANSTPSFYLAGRKIQPRNYDEFVNFIKQAGAATPPPAGGPSVTP